MDKTEDELNERPSLERIELKPGIYDLTDQIHNSLVNETPLSDETLNILRTFKKDYSFEEDIQKRGRETILREMKSALEIFDIQEAREAVKEGLESAQRINPEVEIKPFPVVFLFVPGKKDATSLRGQGCAININSLRRNEYLRATPYGTIESSTTHEAVHIFLRQLQVSPDTGEEKALKKEVYDFLWEEGLTTYVEPHKYRHHDVIVEDIDFWLEVVRNWFKTEDMEEKKRILRNCKGRESCIAWLRDMYVGDLENLSPKGDVDEIFMRMLSEMNGPGYHIGAYLWEKQIKKGNSLKDLVMKGSGEVEEWIKKSGER